MKNNAYTKSLGVTCLHVPHLSTKESNRQEGGAINPEFLRFLINYNLKTWY